jgi:hypothetical protein
MRIANWNPSVLGEFKGVAYERLLQAAYYVKILTAQKLQGQIRRNISRPVYKKGPYAGEPWTARQAGSLLRSVRVTQKKEDMGKTGLVADLTNIRIYAGNYMAYYADIFEFYTPFMRPAFNESESAIKEICGVE